MNYITLSIGNMDYKLRMTTRSMCELEKKLGRNPIDILIETTQNRLPKTTDLVFILHSALQPYSHNIKIDDVYDLFDEYIADGHTYMDFINVVIELFKVSGVIRDEKDEGESPNA